MYVLNKSKNDLFLFCFIFVVIFALLNLFVFKSDEHESIGAPHFTLRDLPRLVPVTYVARNKTYPFTRQIKGITRAAKKNLVLCS